MTTGVVDWAAIVAMTSSASVPSTSAMGIPAAVSTRVMIGSCPASSAGISVPAASSLTRAALYSGMIAVRKAGRQSASIVATTRAEPKRRIICATVSSTPRTALTG